MSHDPSDRNLTPNPTQGAEHHQSEVINFNLRKPYQLPDFDTLLNLAKHQPEQLEKIRIEGSESIINQAPKAHRRRLQGLLFQINMINRRAKTPLSACIQLSDMMHDSLAQMGEQLNAELHQPSPLHGQRRKATEATAANDAKSAHTSKVLPFKR